MKVECLKDRLRETVNIAERVTGKNLSLPILSSILIEAKGKSLTIKATNLEVGVELQVPAKVEAEGKVALNAGVFSNFLSNVGREERISLELVNENIHISTPSSSTLIKCFPTDDFPEIPRVEGGDTFTVSVRNLVSGIKAVLYASAVSDIKPEIASVYLYKDGVDLIFVATDSFRLAEKKIGLKNDQEILPAIIPFRSASEIVRTFDGLDEDIAIELNKNQISFFSNDSYLTANIIDGIFPDYRQIMPKGHKTRVTIAKSELIDALKLCNIFADRFNQIDLNIKPKDKTFEISSRNQDVGENKINLKSNLEGEEMEVSFNAKYIIDCFQSIASDNVVLEFNERNRAMLVSGLGDSSFRYLVMPVNR